jgi:hypothetical protein
VLDDNDISDIPAAFDYLRVVIDNEAVVTADNGVAADFRDGGGQTPGLRIEALKPGLLGHGDVDGRRHADQNDASNGDHEKSSQKDTFFLFLAPPSIGNIYDI